MGSDMATLLDDLVRSQQQRLWDREAERLRGLEVDYQLELGRLLDGQLGGPGTLEDLVHEDRRAPPDVVDVRAVAHQTAGLDVLPELVHGREPAPSRQLRDAPGVRVENSGREHEYQIGR